MRRKSSPSAKPELFRNDNMSIYVGRIACQDLAGLVHQITGVLFRAAVNVTENHEFVDHVAGRFFMRTQFEGQADVQKLRTELLKLLPAGAQCDIRELKPRDLLVFASREPHCLGDLLLRHSTREMSANILAVVSPNEDCRHLVERFEIPFHLVPVNALQRPDHERKVLEIVGKYKADYLVLARYMRILTSDFISRFPERIINIHHSFLPAFIGRDPYQQAYGRGVKIIGATSHFVTEQLDEGPIITQDTIAVDHTVSAEQMAKRGQDVEKLVLARGLELVLEDRIMIDGNRTVIFS